MTHHHGEEKVGDAPLLSRFCLMAGLNGAWIDIIGDEEPGSSRTTASQEHGFLGNILQQLLYLASTAAKLFVFSTLWFDNRSLYGACPFQ